jgi:hypothetical protein
MPRAFGRRFGRSSAPPPFTWQPESRRPPRYVAAGALAIAVAALAYGTAQVATYMRTPADRAVVAKAPAGSADSTPNAGSMAGAADRAAPVAALAGPDASRPAAAQQTTAPQPASPAPAPSQSSPQASTSALSSAAPETDAPDQAAAEDTSGTVAVLNAGTAEAEAESKSKSEPLSRAKPPAEKASRSERRGRLTNLRPRNERQLGVRQRRAREVREADLPWRFAPAIRVDIETLRREDGRPPQPFAPRYYGWSRY